MLWDNYYPGTRIKAITKKTWLLNAIHNPHQYVSGTMAKPMGRITMLWPSPS